MSYEFKRLSDVDIVETPSETANVLIEEDGVIKKAPKTAVGGAGGSSNEYDMIIHAFYDTYHWIDEIQPEDCEIVAGSYEDLVEKLMSDNDYAPKILFKFKTDYYYLTIQFNTCYYSRGSTNSLGMETTFNGELFYIRFWNGELDHIGPPVMPK